MRLLVGVAKQMHHVIMIGKYGSCPYLYLRRREATLTNKIKKNVRNAAIYMIAYFK